MRPDRAISYVLFLFAASALMAYAITYRGPAASLPPTLFAADQGTFYRTRTITSQQGTRLHSLRFVTYTGSVTVEWYDSALAGLKPQSGIYATLLIDGREIASSLTGSFFGASEIAPATLRWAGRLQAGPHAFVIELSRVDAGAEAPYVAPAGAGTDSLVISQEPSSRR